MAFNATVSAATPITRSGSDRISESDYHGLMRTVEYDSIAGYLSSIQENPAIKGMFMFDSMGQDTLTEGRKIRPGGQVPLNEDSEDIPMQTNQSGFPYSWGASYFRKGAYWTRQTASQDDIGEIQSQGQYLKDSGMRTIKFAMSDALDRGVDPTTTQFLCNDGMGLVDSGRPNPDPDGGTWSNLVASAATTITPSLLDDARQLAWNIPMPNGDKCYGQTVDKIYIPAAYENALRIVLKTENDVGTAINDINPEYNRGWKYEVIPELTANNIFFTLKGYNSPENTLKFRWRENPTVVPLDFDRNPDMSGMRIRFAFTIGCVDPRNKIMGAALTAL